MEQRPELPSLTERPEICVEGTRVATFPRELAERLDLREVCAAAGVDIAENERVVVSRGEASIACGIVLDEQSTQVVEAWQREGVEPEFYTPLEGVIARAIVGSRRPKTVVLRLKEGVAYVALSEEHRICYAETLLTNSDEQLVNLLALLNQDFDLLKARFILLGKESEPYRKTIRRYFRRVSCEK